MVCATDSRHHSTRLFGGVNTAVNPKWGLSGPQLRGLRCASGYCVPPRHCATLGMTFLLRKRAWQMSEDIHPFNIMCKPVCGTCNLDCRYCYYTMKMRELYPQTTRFQMTPDVLESYTRQYMEAMPVRVEFGWQGGEPLLAGKDFFRRAIDLQKQFTRPGQVVSNALQTNGTLIDDEWCQFLAENKFLVGISLDGPPQWHDSFRRDRAGEPTFHKAWGGLEKLRAHKVEFNVLVTLNSANAPHAGDIYRYFVNRGIQYLQFIPILERNADGSPTDYSCTPEQFGRFMLDVYEQWASRDIGRVSERFIDSVLHQLLFDRPAMCCYAPRCANAHVLEFNGDLYVCDHFVYKQWKIGNIMERPLAELVRDPRLEEFSRLKTEPPEACRACDYYALCRGGCPKHHMPIGSDPKRHNHFCEGYKLFFREALDELRAMVPYIRMNRIPPLKGAKPAAATASHAPAGPAPAAGRNDPCPCGSGKKYKSCCGRQ